MLFDTDVLIWTQRGNANAAAMIDAAEKRLVSVQTLMELLQCAKDKAQHRLIKRFLADLDFSVLPLTHDIGHRALVYVELHTLASGLRAGDALIAATAIEHGLPLATANGKHFKAITDIDLRLLRP